eukprot:1764019-Pyramimonas_sp.AAC.1
MAQAESPLAAQVIVIFLLAPPPPSSDPFVLILPRYALPLDCKGFADRAWQGMNIPPKKGYDRRRRGRVSRVWDMHIE